MEISKLREVSKVKHSLARGSDNDPRADQLSLKSGTTLPSKANDSDSRKGGIHENFMKLHQDIAVGIDFTRKIRTRYSV